MTSDPRQHIHHAAAIATITAPPHEAEAWQRASLAADDARTLPEAARALANLAQHQAPGPARRRMLRLARWTADQTTEPPQT